MLQSGCACMGCAPFQSLPRCTKCNSLPINSQCTNFMSFDVDYHYPCILKVCITRHVANIITMTASVRVHLLRVHAMCHFLCIRKPDVLAKLCSSCHPQSAVIFNIPGLTRCTAISVLLTENAYSAFTIIITSPSSSSSSSFI